MTHIFVRFTAALALAGAIISSPAYAVDLGEARSVAVRIADLDLTGPAGRATLMHRIGNAARAVCGYADARDLIASRLSTVCRTDAIQAAMPQVQLALEASRTGRRLAAANIAVRANAL